MIVAGCDVGSLTSKAVILDGDTILSSAMVQGKSKPAQSSAEVMDLALKEAGLSLDELSHVVGTGYGRRQIPFVDSMESEISCHAKGARHLMPSCRMVIDIGGQDAKATKMDDQGKVTRFFYNDKCASGTGRFLEVMAKALEVPLDKLGALGEKATEKLTISNQCVIFAETEVISLLNDGKETADILGALHSALAKRVASMAKSIGVVEDVVMTGGVANNCGVFRALSAALGVNIKSIEGMNPQIVGALGAALYAREKS